LFGLDGLLHKEKLPIVPTVVHRRK